MDVSLIFENTPPPTTMAPQFPPVDAFNTTGSFCQELFLEYIEQKTREHANANPEWHSVTNAVNKLINDPTIETAFDVSHDVMRDKAWQDIQNGTYECEQLAHDYETNVVEMFEEFNEDDYFRAHFCYGDATDYLHRRASGKLQMYAQMCSDIVMGKYGYDEPLSEEEADDMYDTVANILYSPNYMQFYLRVMRELGLYENSLSVITANIFLHAWTIAMDQRNNKMEQE